MPKPKTQTQTILCFKIGMDALQIFLLSVFLISLPPFPFSCSTPLTALHKGSSLSTTEILISHNRKFSAGFYLGSPEAHNAYCFAIWFNDTLCNTNCTILWTANRNIPVNGKLSKLSLLNNGNLILSDAGQAIVWATNTFSSTSLVQLRLEDTGNLVLYDTQGVEHKLLWQSFDSPTNTLLPQQPFTRYSQLVSSRSETNISCGYYKLFFDFDNVLRLAFDGPETSSIYWPDPTALDYQTGRTRYNDTRMAVFDIKGQFNASDHFGFFSTDFGVGPWRRLTLDFDGNLRLYSLDEAQGTWSVTGQAMSQPCRIHESCGPNSICVYEPRFGRKCSCPPRYQMKNLTDWSGGCEPKFKISCKEKQVGFVELPRVEFYGYDLQVHRNYTLERCKEACLDECECKGFQFQLMAKGKVYNCYLKRELRNGYRSTNFNGTLYLKFPKSEINTYQLQSLEELKLNCSDKSTVPLDRKYHKNGQSGTLRILLWFACSIGLVEIIVGIFLLVFFLHKERGSNAKAQGYLVSATGFRRFSYVELKKATRNFGEEIGRGGGGTVYKAILLDQRIAAVKQLKIRGANQGEEEFLAEVGVIGRLNHKHLIDIWGFCAEGRHRLIVYEYMENGSLADSLLSNSLDWDRRFAIAVGTAKGLAYLHEECLEWVLHCDVKPQNILLDSEYQPKVSDFGLSKVLNRSGVDYLNFSRIRGTRGYMAPEWTFVNQPITSKADVYSYGMVVLEMVTGKNPAGMSIHSVESQEKMQQGLVEWVREMKNEASERGRGSWVKEIIEPKMASDELDMSRIESLVKVALQCVEEDKETRPSMSQVVEMLL